MANKRAANKRQASITFELEELARIDAAACAVGMTRSQFMVEAALAFVRAAEEREKSKEAENHYDAPFAPVPSSRRV